MIISSYDIFRRLNALHYRDSSHSWEGCSLCSPYPKEDDRICIQCRSSLINVPKKLKQSIYATLLEMGDTVRAIKLSTYCDVNKAIRHKGVSEYRKKYKLSQKELARLWHISPDLISKVERGERLLPIKLERQLCKKPKKYK